jgi:methyl-accepting chemotaxis protein
MSFLDNVKISKKLPMLIVGLVFFSVSISMGLSAFFTIKDFKISAEKSTYIVNEEKLEALQSYFSSIRDDLLISADNGFTKEAMYNFRKSWLEIDGNPTEYLQNTYLPQGMDAAKRIDVVKAKDGSLYSDYHARYHPFFKSMLETRGYYDIFLFDTRGNLLYTVFKELDYATNIYSGKWKDTDLANAYRASIKASNDSVSFFDFKAYEPSYGAPASFMSTPVYDKGRKIGVLVFQMPIDNINHVMARADGEAESTEHLIVGEDGTYRNNPHKDRENGDVILKEKVTTYEVARAFKDNSHGYGNNGHTVYAYDVFSFGDVRWVVTTHIKLAEILEPIIDSQIHVALASLVILLIFGVIAFFTSRSLSQPLLRQTNIMTLLTGGDLSVEISDQDRKDEIGDIAKSVQTFKENALHVKQLEADQEAQRVKTEEDKKEAQIMLAADFDSRVGGVIQSLSESAESMTATAQQMQGSSQQTAEISNTVAAAATEADSNVQTVATASEELAASSSEIARQIDAVAKKSSAAAQDAAETSESVNELNVLADSIGEVIGTIKDIAEQTNLLALNATIEAARAGEAGKGFAVVADEVKKLANETATKTEEIDERVNKIQEAIRNSVTAMDKIISNVSEIDAATTTVASAVEEQNAATAEIGRNVTEASTGTQQVSQSIIQVQQNAAESGEASTTVLGSASELKQQSDILKVEVDKFLNEIRGDSAA